MCENQVLSLRLIVLCQELHNKVEHAQNRIRFLTNARVLLRVSTKYDQ